MTPGGRALLLVLALACLAPATEAPRPALPPRPAFEDALPPSPTLAERIAEIRARVQAAVVYPPAARRLGVTGVAHIRFAIGSNGQAHGIETVRSSGSPSLDRAAERGARDAGRLPYVYGRVEVPVRFALERRR